MSRALSYAKIPGSGGSSTDEIVTSPARWYKFRSWRLAVLCVVLLVCAWNLGGLAHSGSTAIRTPADHTLQVRGPRPGARLHVAEGMHMHVHA